jgi:hypothetical protein
MAAVSSSYSPKDETVRVQMGNAFNLNFAPGSNLMKKKTHL